jgi:hypothetical protein
VAATLLLAALHYIPPAHSGETVSAEKAQISSTDADEIPDPQVTPGEMVSTDRAAACAQGHTKRPRIEDASRRVLEHRF